MEPLQLEKIIMKISNSAAVLSSICFLFACSNEPPKCSDSSTIDQLKLYLLGEEGIKHFGKSIQVTDIVPTMYDKDLRKYSCQCNIVFANETKSYKLPVVYYSQVGDDGNQLLTVRKPKDIDLATMANVVGMTEEWLKKHN